MERRTSIFEYNPSNFRHFSNHNEACCAFLFKSKYYTPSNFNNWLIKLLHEHNTIWRSCEYFEEYGKTVNIEIPKDFNIIRKYYDETSMTFLVYHILSLYTKDKKPISKLYHNIWERNLEGTITLMLDNSKLQDTVDTMITYAWDYTTKLGIVSKSNYIY